MQNIKILKVISKFSSNYPIFICISCDPLHSHEDASTNGSKFIKD